MPSKPPRPGLYVERVREDTLRYSSELLQENERLRLALIAAEQEAARHRDETDRTRGELARLVEREQSLCQALGRAQADNQRFAERYLEIEQENSNLANLYVASYRLHGTIERAEVLQVLQEITANLIGSEEVAIFEVVPGERALTLVAAFGLAPEPYQRVTFEQGLIGHTAAAGCAYVRGEGPVPRGVVPEPELTACVPLKIGTRVTGVIALFRLLPQKPGIETLDRELFDLLATHAATALHCSRPVARD